MITARQVVAACVGIACAAALVTASVSPVGSAPTAAHASAPTIAEESPVAAVATTAAPRSTHAVSWRLASVSGDGRVLQIAIGVGGGCDTFLRIDVAESATEVHVAPLVATAAADTFDAAGTPGACAQNDVLVTKQVSLAAPLGSRLLTGQGG
jgi:hypothetical protein